MHVGYSYLIMKSLHLEVQTRKHGLVPKTRQGIGRIAQLINGDAPWT